MTEVVQAERADAVTETVSGSGLTPLMLNHAAWVTHDVEATANFYTKIMGMELASTIFDDSIPSTGDNFAYFHIFFRMQDGSTIAFFEAPGLPDRAEATHPAYDIFDHIALQAADREEVDRWADWLRQNGIALVGPTDHKGLIYSIYFHDPNGVRLEITAPLDPDWNQHTEQGHIDLKLWCDTKKKAATEGRDVAESLLELIRDQRRRYSGY
ncbi:VOC family protein [Sphingopyxis sp. SE2]|uniref:VOC family protein n=1 Tax=Sphingopyxis sp. SE2 TaxID=1586240 RepID=UPI0028C28CEC|nr:VOC family protein [Sphingopyxis sp. SE2]MDT7531696.1 VOC family protein [Sphingopyxis sp. SE2]